MLRRAILKSEKSKSKFGINSGYLKNLLKNCSKGFDAEKKLSSKQFSDKIRKSNLKKN